MNTPIDPEADLRGLFTDDIVPKLVPGSVLVSLVAIGGSAPRPIGAQMVIDPEAPGTVRAWGYLTGGCLEEAIVAEACAAKAEGKNRLVRYGAGSPYLDLVLPCGSSIDLYFDVGLDKDLIAHLKSAYSERMPVSVRMDYASLGSATLLDRPVPTGCDGKVLIRCYEPPLRLVIAGTGPVGLFLARMARDAGLQVVLHTPDDQTALHGENEGVEVQRLGSPRSTVYLEADERTAIAVLFHDHDWEPAILRSALRTPAFYIGAMGSVRTHQARLDTLTSLGIDKAAQRRIQGPAGVIPGARSAPEIATSILAQVLHEARLPVRETAAPQRELGLQA